MTVAPRLRSEIWVQAYLRRRQSDGAFAALVRKGDPDAGAIAVKVYKSINEAAVFIQSRDLDGRPLWRNPLSEDDGALQRETAIDAWLDREASIDPDLWIIEVHDREGRAALSADDA